MAILEKDTQLQFPHALIIDASAGSGKTHTLTQRFVQFILSQNIPSNDLANILAITFTNNAAREMKQRILEWLKTLVLNRNSKEMKQTVELISLSPKEIARRAGAALDMIIDRYSDFHIQTIDSFMSRILRSSANELGMPLQLNITESYAAFTDLALASALRAVGDYIKKEKVDDFLDLLTKETTSFPWNPVNAIRKNFMIFQKQEGKVLEKIEFIDEWTTIKEKFKYVVKVYRELTLLGLDEKSSSRCKVAEHMRQGNIREFITSYSETNLPFKKDKTKQAVYEKACQLWKDLSAHIEEMLGLVSISHYGHYGSFYERFKDILNTVKRKKEIIHFDDINKKLSQYIKRENVPEIYYRLGEVLYHFLLDEFQDTDRVQWENIQPLLEEGFSKGGSLFAVGDTKQAIYMFRKADYRIMRTIVEGIKSRGKGFLPQPVIQNTSIIQLKENFRSGGIILDYLDIIFKKKLKDKIGTPLLEQDRTGLTDYVQRVRDDKQKTGYVKTIVVTKDDNTLEKDILFTILDDVVQRYRYRDITVLAKKNKEVEAIVEWLTEKKIQAASLSSLDIRKRKIVMEIVSLLQFLDSPIDNLSFASFISGDIFNRVVASLDKPISREEIFDALFKKTQTVVPRSHYLYVWFREYYQFKDLWNTLFEDLFNKVGYYPLYDLVSLAFRTFKIFDNFQTETSFLVRFLDAIGSLESKGMNSVKDFIQMVAEDEGESILNVILPTYIDAVKVMTFHKAKGSGFPVVINMIYDSGEMYENMFFEKDRETLLVYHITKAMSEKSSKLHTLYAEKKLDEKIQNLNLLYVANTRAQKELYNIVMKKKNQINPVELFENFENGTKEKQKIVRSDVTPTTISLPSKVEISFGQEEERNWSVQRLKETKEGEFYHEILANIEFISDDIEAIVSKVCDRYKEQYDVDKAKKTIQEFLERDEVRIWFEQQPSRQIEREVEYVGENGTLYRFDRVVKDVDKITLIDFKTGREDLPHYRSQLKNYTEILRKLQPGKEIKAYLGFIDIKEVKEVQ